MFLWDRLYWQTKREILADIVAQVFSPLDIDDIIMITVITSKNINNKNIDDNNKNK